MHLLLFWLRAHALSLTTFVLTCVMFAVTFALYDFPLEAVWYPTLLCAILWICRAVWETRCAYKKRRLLRLLVQRPAELIEEALLPPPVTADDIDYQALIGLLLREYRQQRSQYERRYGDTIDYYTLWTHQIKTPITAMRLTLQNEDTSLSHLLRMDLQRVEQYVDMAMAFLRLDAPSTDYLLRPCALDDILRGALKKFSGEFIARKLRLIYEPTGAMVLTDEKWLAFVVEQLLSNALKYTPAGTIAIALDPGPVLRITDSGIGIDPADLPRVFEKGYTGRNGRADKRASGIGLYLCRRICCNLGHTISITSAIGVGTCVRVDLTRKGAPPDF